MSTAPGNSVASVPGVVFTPPPAPSRTSERATCVGVLVIFALAASLTMHFARSMSGGMPMPGSWTMDMMWMIVPGQNWIIAALVFAGMWLAMMLAMMLPSALPMLLIYRRAAAFRGAPRLGALTCAVGAGYFAVWTVFGLLAYGAGEAITRAAMVWPSWSRVIPLATAAALVLAGIYQLTPWKSACLKHCRDPLLVVAHHLNHGWRGALRLGIHHGAFCAACCWGLMLIQLVLGIMNLAVMAAVALIIALEKVLVRGALVARLTGYASVLGGVTLAVKSLFTH